MHTTHLRKVGGSIMLAIPPVLLEQLHLHADATVEIAIDNGRLVVTPKKSPHYTLEELLALCHPTKKKTAEDKDWLDNLPIGKELL
jgi:antitoxin ChpS